MSFEKKDQRLSAEQNSILEWLFANIPKSTTDAFGIRWMPGKWGLTSTPSSRAAYSRSLKRLEERGLVLRQNQVSGNPYTQMARASKDEPHNRTTHVQLTQLGEELAATLFSERLT